MDRTIFVLPICCDGTPENVDAFLKQEDLQGVAFESIDDADKYLIEVKEKYEKDDRWQDFGIFIFDSHAVQTSYGYKLQENVHI